MKWSYPNRNIAFNLIGVILVIVTVCGLFYVWVINPDLARKTNYGFGPEWDCYYQQKVGPVCMKHVRKPDKSN
jgi:hypothetical protein